MKSVEVWGLTGGIASGKTTVADLFRKAGLPVFDADQIARDLIQPGGKAHAAATALMGTTDRKEMRKKAFESPELRKKLEALLHPLIALESEALFQQFTQGRVIYEAALLVETGRHRKFSGLIVVHAPALVRLKRLVRRDGLDETLAEKMIETQLSDDERCRAATLLIDNSREDLQGLKTQVDAILKSWKEI